MRVIIAGSRGITDPQILGSAIAESGWFEQIDEIVSGGARGVDTLGEQFAASYEFPIKIFVADWDYYGKRAGALRNQEMGDYADALIAVWDGESRGTAHMIRYMERLNKPVFVYRVSPIEYPQPMPVQRKGL